MMRRGGHGEEVVDGLVAGRRTWEMLMSLALLVRVTNAITVRWKFLA